MEEKLLKLLHKDQVITHDQYQRAVEESERTGHRYEAVLQQLQILTEAEIVKYLSQKFRMPIIPWAEYSIDPELLELVPETLAIKHHVFPFEIERGKRRGKILLAVADPSNVAAIDELAFSTGCTVKAGISSTNAIHAAIQEHYGVQETEEPRSGSTGIKPASAAAERFQATQIEAFDTALAAWVQYSDFQDEETDVLSTLDREDPASKVLIELLELAVDRDITEIHLEPFDQEYRVRVRVRGVLQAHTTIPDHVGRDIAKRLRRLMQRTEIGGSRRETPPWIGHFQTQRIRKSSLTVVASFCPTLFGEKILLKPSTLGSLRTVDQLGLTDDSLKLLQRLLIKTEGLLLIMGPPDHGKTTTLYSLLKQYQKAAMHALLIESPVEIVMPGVTQLSGHAPLSSQAWHSLIAYNNPDVLAISDIEDELLLKLAFECASGTKVLATYTADHALKGFKTFAEALQLALKVPLPVLLPVLLDMLDGMLVQRLARTLCPHCKEEIPQSEQNPEFLQQLGLGVEDAPFYRAKGCRECLDTGYHGQTGMLEIIRCDKHIIQALLQHPPISSTQWKQVLADRSVYTLQQQGAQLARKGISSPQEVWRALSA